MKIKIIGDYKGPLGTFKEGEQYHLPRSMVKRLPSDRVRVIEDEGPLTADADVSPGGSDAPAQEATRGKAPAKGKH